MGPVVVLGVAFGVEPAVGSNVIANRLLEVDLIVKIHRAPPWHPFYLCQTAASTGAGPRTNRARSVRSI
jgi:hypothetical protein